MHLIKLREISTEFFQHCLCFSDKVSKQYLKYYNLIVLNIIMHFI